jgi:hypothetical protein
MGHREKPVHVSRDGYVPKLKWISKKFVVLWDEEDKRGWLVNGTSALLHLLRASLEHNRTDKFKSAFLFKSEEMKEASIPYTADSAIDVLLNPKNMKLEIYPEKGEMYLRLEDRVEHFYNILEKIIDHQADIAGQRTLSTLVWLHLKQSVKDGSISPELSMQLPCLDVDSAKLCSRLIPENPALAGPNCQRGGTISRPVFPTL